MTTLQTPDIAALEATFEESRQAFNMLLIELLNFRDELNKAITTNDLTRYLELKIRRPQIKPEMDEAHLECIKTGQEWAQAVCQERERFYAVMLDLPWPIRSEYLFRVPLPLDLTSALLQLQGFERAYKRVQRQISKWTCDRLISDQETLQKLHNPTALEPGALAAD